MNGRPLSIEWVDKNVSAILETWFLGTTIAKSKNSRPKNKMCH